MLFGRDRFKKINAIDQFEVKLDTRGKNSYACFMSMSGRK